MKNQITQVLPRSAWEKVIIQENNEPLVEMKEIDRLKIGLVSKSYTPSFFVRQTVAEKLYRVSETLPQEMHLVLIEGYRTMQAQQSEWNRVFQELQQENPTWTHDQIEFQVRQYVAKPAPLANHHCGGAIDVTLCYSNGVLLDMGSSYISEAPITDKVRFPMFSSEITKEQHMNRKILRDAMESEDFIWYPGEWWHYCWGDRMWAVYSNQIECYYGPAYLE